MQKQSTAVSHALSTFSVLLVIFVWLLYSMKIDNRFIMPYPGEVFKEFINLFTEWETYVVLGTTFYRLVITLSVSALLGLILGLISGIRYQVEAFLFPIVTVLRTLPLISIIVVVLILYGNQMSIYIISFLLLFPLIYQAVLDGVKNIKPIFIEALSMESAPISWGAVKAVYFPMSLPYFRTSLLQASGLGIKVLVVAEFIAQTKNSIGWELYFHRINLEYATVFAWTIVLVIIVTAMESLVNRYIRYLK